MVEYTVFFPVLSTLTWDTLLTLRSTWGFYLNHLIPLRPFKSVFDNVLLEHGGLPHVLPLAVHLIFLPEQVEGVILSHFYSLSFLVFQRHLSSKTVSNCERCDLYFVTVIFTEE